MTARTHRTTVTLEAPVESVEEQHRLSHPFLLQPRAAADASLRFVLFFATSLKWHRLPVWRSGHSAPSGPEWELQAVYLFIFCCFKLGLFGLALLHVDIYYNIIKSTLKNQMCIYISYSCLVVWLCVESRWTSRGRHLESVRDGKFPHRIPELCSRRLFSAIFFLQVQAPPRNTKHNTIRHYCNHLRDIPPQPDV